MVHPEVKRGESSMADVECGADAAEHVSAESVDSGSSSAGSHGAADAAGEFASRPAQHGPGHDALIVQRLTVGRIVLVRSSAFQGECPALVSAVFEAEDGDDACNAYAFTNTVGIQFLTALRTQSESSNGWGWRWPPRLEPPQILADDMAIDLAQCRPGDLVWRDAPDKLRAPLAAAAPALSAQEPLEAV
jgi:hypothetical protein